MQLTVADMILQPSPGQAAPAATESTLISVLVEARALAEEQRALAQALQAAQDPKHWYVQLCHLATQEMLALNDSNQLCHARLTLRLLAQLHSRFLHNLRRWLSPALGTLEPHWDAAFCAFNLAGEATTVYSVLTGLHLALRAQLEYDLPQAVAQALHGGQVSDQASYSASLQGTSLALRRAIERLLAETAAPHLPRWLGWRAPQLLGKTLELLLRRYVYDVVEQRACAVARGIRLADKASAKQSGHNAPPAQPVPSAQDAADSYRGLALLPAAAPGSSGARDLSPPAASVTSRKRAACETFPDSEADAA